MGVEIEVNECECIHFHQLATFSEIRFLVGKNDKL